MTEPRVQLLSFGGNREGWGASFSGYAGEIIAETEAEVHAALSRLEEATGQGLHAVGFICYEAAHAINPTLPAAHRRDSALPLLWFALYRGKGPQSEPPTLLNEDGTSSTSAWRSSLSANDYVCSIDRIHDYIRRGHSYQVNFTMQQAFHFSGTPDKLFAGICRSQLPDYAAHISHPQFTILSASPELFFRLENGTVTVRPMKGTASRGGTPDDDAVLASGLSTSPKERAENLMIVDLLRNDLGIIARTGSVQATDLFRVEQLPTLHQMTSTITAELEPDTGMAALLSALFPCGSITGAPKRRTMEIIDELETSPRGIYTGCIGWISPDRSACFSVAIRTLVLDTSNGEGTMGVGSGITIYAEADTEYSECLAKSAFARFPLPPFRLLESLLWTEDQGYPRLQLHLDRLQASAGQLGFSFQRQLVEDSLHAFAATLHGRHKVRLLLTRDGSVELEETEIHADPAGTVLTVGISSLRVDSVDPLLRHKTDHRPLFRQALLDHPDCDELLFLNERGELTEGSYHTLVLRHDGQLLTPPLSSGLLPGIMRSELLKAGEAAEAILFPEQLAFAEEIWLVNSVRGWRRARLADSTTAGLYMP